MSNRVELGRFKRAEKEAHDLSKANRPRLNTVMDMKVIRLSMRASPEEYYEYCIQFHNYLLETAGAVLDLQPGLVIPDGVDLSQHTPILRGVPVTHTKVPEEEFAFFLVELFDPDNENAPVIQFPIRLPDIYSTGFRVLRIGDDGIKKIWNSFDDSVQIPLPPSLFINTRSSNLKMSYQFWSAIKIHQGTLAQIYNFYLQFPEEQGDADVVITEEDTVIKDTQIFILAEAQRYYFAQLLTMKGLVCTEDTPQTSTDRMETMIHRWSDTSDATLLLWLSELEKQMALLVEEDHHRYQRQRSLFDDSRTRAMKEFDALLGKGLNWKQEIELGMVFPIRRHPDDRIDLSRVIRNLFVIRSRWPTILQVIMRQRGYKKPFLEFIYKPKEQRYQ